MKQNDFSYISFVYDFLATIVFGNSIKKSQLPFLSAIPENANVLILGGGTGWILEQLLKQQKKITIYYVELSSTMIQRTKKRCANYDCHNVHYATSIPPVKYDVVITPYFLDLFKEPELNNVVTNITLHLKDNALWLVTDFTSTKWWHKVMLISMYTFFRITANIQASTLPNWKKHLDHHKFYCIDSRGFYRGFIQSCLYQKVKQ